MQFNIPAEHRNASGVYIIRNTVNGKVYVGSAVKLRRRCLQHTSALRLGKHVNSHLQAHAIKYGLHIFSMELLELCPANMLLETEQIHLDAFNVLDPAFVFNAVANTNWTGARPGCAGRKGRKKTPEEIAKQVASRRSGAGYGMSEEQRCRQHDERKGKRLSEAAYSPEATAKRVEARRAAGNYKRTEESIQKQLEKQIGRKVADDIKAKISATTKGKKWTPEEIAKRVASKKASGKPWVSEQARAKISATLKGRPVKWTPEQIARRTATRKANNAARKIATQHLSLL